MKTGSEAASAQDGARAGFAGRRVAVTGAAGFIGAAVCRSLAAAEAEVTGIDSDPGAAQRIRDSGAAAVAGDVTDPGAMRAALAKAELLVHTAAIVSDAGRMEDHVRVNVGGTANVIDAARAAGVERTVHISSVVVYGYEDPSVQDEGAHLRTCGVPYIDTKSASDRIARRRGAVVIRPGDVYGPGSIPWSVRPLQLAKAGRLGVPGRGEGLMLAVYIDDLVDSILLALGRGAPGEAYTAWKDDETVTFEDFFNRIAAIAGGPPARRLPRTLLRSLGLAMEGVARLGGGAPEMTRHSVTLIDRRGSVSAAKLRALGWEPRVGLDEGMRRTAEWFRSQGMI